MLEFVTIDSVVFILILYDVTVVLTVEINIYYQCLSNDEIIITNVC